MNGIIDIAKQKLKNNKSIFLFCLSVTVIIGMITHAYMYFQDAFSHDSLNEFYGYEYNEWKIQLGRFLIPVYRLFTRGNLTLPWIIGLYSLLWISLSVLLTIKLFNIKSKVFVTLISGVFTANITVIATTATYIHDLDVDMFALFMSVLAAFLWCRYKKGYIFSALSVFVTLGLYQCYISVTLTLIIIFYILELLKQEKFKVVFWSGLKLVFMLLIVGALYFVAFKSVLYFGNIQEHSGYNTLDNMFSLNFIEMLKNIIKTYVYTVYYFLFPQNTLPKFLIIGITAVLLCIAGSIIVFKIFSKKIAVKERLLILIMIVLLPLAMNISQVLSGMSHDLMHFALWLVYLFVLLIVYNAENLWFRNKEKAIIKTIIKIGKSVSILIIIMILISNIVLANELYLKKDLEQDATLSFFTRVVDKMDSFDEYNREKDSVVFIGVPEVLDEDLLGFENAKTITGTSYNYALGTTDASRYKNYFKYKLHYNVIAIDEDSICLEDDVIRAMPVFPKEGSIQMVDGILVVKLGEAICDS